MTRSLVAAALVALLACDGPATTPPFETPAQPAPNPDPDPPPAGPTRCGDASTVFTEAAALPADAGLVALVATGDAGLDSALLRLERHARGGDSGLSVPTAFVLGQWRWEVPMVRGAFAAIGVDAGMLASVQTGTLRLWAAPLGCPADAVIAGLARDFEVADKGATAIATPRDRTRFAHDVVVRTDAVVLCPPGTGRRVLAAWERPWPTAAGISLRQRAFDLEPSALRIAIRETGILAESATDARSGDHLLRVDGERLDATLAP